MRIYRLDCTALLHEEHEATLGLLQRMDALLRRWKKNKPPAADDQETLQIVEEFLTLMRAEITNHFDFEEEHLFPVFAAAADPFIPNMLKGEHDAIRQVAKRMLALADGVAEGQGFSPADWAEFHALGMEIIERETFHIQKEEMGFLPAIEQVLPPEKDQEVVAAYKAMKAAG